MSERKVRAGKEAHAKRIGIHGLPKEQQNANRKKGNIAFLEKMKDPTYREAHRKKIAAGKAKNKKIRDNFGFF